MIDRRWFLATSAAFAGVLGARRAAAGSEPSISIKPELARIFSDAGTEGTFVLRDLKADKLVMTDETRARQGLLPASTFKVPHALIALETGVVADVDEELIRWDGVTREIEEWNRDHTLRSAMKYSVVPAFQQIARRIGAERMQHFVEAFSYGNRDIGGAIDSFWLDGNLRITPIEQTRFFERLVLGDLPVSDRSLELVREIVPSETAPGAVFHAKTGTIAADGKPAIGWLAGWVQHGDEAVPFALNIDLHGEVHLAGRMAMARALVQGAETVNQQPGPWVGPPG